MASQRMASDGAPPGHTAARLLQGYAPPAGALDEALDPAGAPQPPWAGFGERLDRLGPEALRRRWSRSQRLIQENGVAFTPYASSDEATRPWTLDPLPILVGHDEWREVAAGLTQRARLLERLLADLFGPQTLIREGVLPAALLNAHPGYRLALRTGAGETPPPRRRLHLYAADLGRAPDGRWWVLGDRTEAPSGVGFALENRVVVSRMLPEAFRECRVRRMAPFFLQLRETLAAIAPAGTPNPIVALLSQGSGHPNYFEDAYLARYLGYPLVEGGDLTVRGRRLWLKTLEGLTPIDVLLRRPNTELCDPLELGGASRAGVAGLLQASRDGALAIANRPGSGLVESPVFMAFMPRVCQALLGEKLRLPGVATWWCGEPSSLDYVLANLDTLVLKRAYRKRGEESLLTAELRDTPPERLATMLREDPHAFVAQERVERSTAPAWIDDGVVGRRIAVRSFVVAGPGPDDAPTVLEGGLARTSSTDGPLETSLLDGEGSKDVWVVSDQPVEPVTLLPGEQTELELVRIGAELPSRVADNSFWLGRHLERADAKSRLLRIVATRLSGEDEPAMLAELPPLLRALAEQGQIEPGYAVAELRDLLPHVETSLPTQAMDRSQSGSLAATVERMFSSASLVRDRLSQDAWRLLLRISQTPRADGGVADLTDVINLTDELVIDLAAVGGLVTEGMTRTQFYRFLDIGRRLERAVQLVDLLTACLVEAPTAGRPLLEALLEAADSRMTYRARYRANLQLAAVLDLLVTDATNPRSLAYQLETLERHVGKLPRTGDDHASPPQEERLVLSMVHALRIVDVKSLTESQGHARPGPLVTLLERLGRDLPALSDAISLKYLVHAGPPKQLSPY